MKTFALICSLALNVCLGVFLLYLTLEGCAEVADGRFGVLARDIDVGVFDTSEVLFALPKGLVVRDASATGADWFEPHRFRIVVTSDDANLVDYSHDVVPLSGPASEYYSSEVTE